jgi:hypothetical protein
VNADKLYRILVDIFGAEYEVRRGQFRVNCINPACSDGKDGGEGGNLEISLEHGIFHCWKCGYKGKLLKLLKDYLGWVPSIDEYISPEDLRRVSSDPASLLIEDRRTQGEFSGLPKDFKTLVSNDLSYVGQKALVYALSRMDKKDIINYGVGYCGLGEYKRRVVIPCYEGDKVVYFSARTFMGGKPVYKNPDKSETGMGKEEVVFNIDGAAVEGCAVICEGVFDAIRVGRAGVAVFGTELHDEQFYKLHHAKVKKYYVLLDRDLPGIEAALKMARKLKSHQSEVSVVFPPQGDPSDYPRQVIGQWLSASENFDPITEVELLKLLKT